MREGLALVNTNQPYVYLGIETDFWSSGTGPVTLAPVGAGWGVKPLLRPATGEHWFRFVRRPF